VLRRDTGTEGGGRDRQNKEGGLNRRRGGNSRSDPRVKEGFGLSVTNKGRLQKRQSGVHRSPTASKKEGGAWEKRKTGEILGREAFVDRSRGGGVAWMSLPVIDQHQQLRKRGEEQKRELSRGKQRQLKKDGQRRRKICGSLSTGTPAKKKKGYSTRR